MTEQIETDFWAEQHARDAAARGRQADPSACGTCRSAVKAGGQVEHDECAQRATLLPAPDAPSYELITGMSEEELAALPPRFHVPVYMESSTPQLWVCAVCWGDGWVTGWPCKTAVEHGQRVFTPEHDAETRAAKQSADLEHLRTERDGFRDQRNAVFTTNQKLVAEVEASGLARITAENETRKAFHANREAAERAQKEIETLRTRVAELEAERKKYVGAEPTIAEEMAYISQCLQAVAELQLPEKLKVDTIPDAYRNGYIHALADMRAALDAPERKAYPPALPWAALMDDDDLQEFLGDLIDSLNSTAATTRHVLVEVEKTCGTWRAIAEAQHAHNTAPGQDGNEPR